MVRFRRFAGEIQGFRSDAAKSDRDHGTATSQPLVLESIMHPASPFRRPFKNIFEALLAASVLAVSATRVMASPEDDVRAVFDQFVTAQNAHDINGVRELLLDSPNFLWVTRGAPVWGRDAALKRFEMLYQGTWKLSPDSTALKAVLLTDTTAQIHVPITFNIGLAGQTAPDAPFLMNQTLVKTAVGWRIANILPIALTAPAALAPK
jgi:uncharacterized protein (TIGR02246 family)